MYESSTRLGPDCRTRTICPRAGRTDCVDAGVLLVLATIGDKGRGKKRQETLKLDNHFKT